MINKEKAKLILLISYDFPPGTNFGEDKVYDKFEELKEYLEKFGWKIEWSTLQ